MFTAIATKPGCDVTKFEIKSFFLHNKKVKANINSVE